MPFKPYYEEEGFLVKLKIKPNELEPLADGCTKVYVWHTRTQKHSTPIISILPTTNRACATVLFKKDATDSKMVATTK